jgi:hypothetical protein
MQKEIRQLTVKTGGVRIEMEYRLRGSDGGLSLKVYGGEGDEAPEVLRFDCFERRPHFHYMGRTNRKVERISKKTVPDPLEWTLSRIKGDLPSMFWKAGYRKLSQEIDQPAIARALAKREKEIIRLSQNQHVSRYA